MCSDFMFDEAEYAAVKQGWVDIVVRVNQAGRRFDRLDQIMSQLPAEDLATTGFQTRARHAMESARASNTALREFAGAYLRLLERTGKAYANKDDGNAQVMNGTNVRT